MFTRDDLGRVSAYLNGVVLYADANEGVHNLGTIDSLRFGRGGKGEPNQLESSWYKGMLDEIRLYNYELSASEVGDVYHADMNLLLPDPMTWLTLPHAVGPTAISMTATDGSHASGVEYCFLCVIMVNGKATTSHNSGWQSDSTYVDIGLTPGETYSYQVKGRAKNSSLTGKYSVSHCVNL